MLLSTHRLWLVIEQDDFSAYPENDWQRTILLLPAIDLVWLFLFLPEMSKANFGQTLSSRC